MNVSKRGFWAVALATSIAAGGLGVAFAASAGEWSLLRGGLAGYLSSVLLTARGLSLQLERRGIAAFRALGLYFFLKLLALVAGSALFALWPALGDFRAFALSFVAGFFVVAGAAVFSWMRAGRGGFGVRT